LTSLVNQTVQPSRIVVVNDGSSDGTSEILARVSREHSIIEVLGLPNLGYDIRRVPSNVNRAIESVRGLRTDYLMISGDDSTYPPDYVELLIGEMTENRRIAVASGRPSQAGLVVREHSPSGSGRMVRTSFIESVGGRFPVRAGWEAWLLYRAVQMGYETKVLDDLVYDHVRPRGSGHQFTYWGAAMYTLGYHPLYVLGRIGRHLAKLKSAESSLALFRGYLMAALGSSDPFAAPFDPVFREFVASEQAREVGRVVVSAISHGIG
jgi:glycosyltransferase involved in cell wall biosynthesis